LALVDLVLGASANVADHHGAGHRDGGQHDVAEAINAGVVDQHSDQQDQIGVAIDHGIKETAEARHATAGAGDRAVDEVEYRREKHNQACLKKLPARKHPSAYCVDRETSAGENVGMNTGEN